MPLPVPRGGESQSKFVSRCISAIHGEYTAPDQAAAVCYSQWKRKKEEEAKMARMIEDGNPVRLQTDRFAGGGPDTELPDTLIAGAAGRIQEVYDQEIPPNLRRRSWDTEDDLDELLPIK